MNPYSGLKAVFLNTSLQKEAKNSHTQLLLNTSAAIMGNVGVQIDHIHLNDYSIPPGVYPDMTEHGWPSDDWPEIWQRIAASDIVIIGTPLWLGEESSICRILIERLYAMSGELNEKGQSSFYGKVGACVITGNEDGLKHTAMTLLYAMNHVGISIPPQADCGWIGEVGPGASYGDKLESGAIAGIDNDFTQRNTTIMTWNCMHLANSLKSNDGYDAYGNDRNAWSTGERFGFRPSEPFSE